MNNEKVTASVLYSALKPSEAQEGKIKEFLVKKYGESISLE